MPNISKKHNAASKTGWVIRTGKDGRFLVQSPTKKEAEARARFLAVASLSAVPKKSKLSKTQAEKAVRKILDEKSSSSAGA